MASSMLSKAFSSKTPPSFWKSYLTEAVFKKLTSQFLVLFPWVIWEWLDPIAAFSPIRSEADNNPWFLKAVLDLFHPSLLPCVTFASVLNICSKRGTLVSHSEPSNVNQSSYDILQSMFHCKYYVQALWNVACMAPCDTWLPWQYTFWLNYSISPWNIHC